MAGVIMPEKKKGFLDTATGLLDTAATIVSLRKDLKETPKDDPNAKKTASNDAIQRKIKNYGVT